MDVERFRKKPLLGIIRASGPVDVEGLIDAISSAGLETIEVAMNSDGAVDLIKRAVRRSGNRMMVGAGTVMTQDTLKEALDAGASFIVSPVLVGEVVGYCAKNVIPVFPGAFSPLEVHEAWEAGATMVKVFPSAILGPAYIRELKGPFDHIELLACGGVTPDNIRKFFDCGSSAVAFGSSVFKKEWLERRDHASISRSIKDLIEHA
jgi:2-dehydro-3-deoxyphosphogluconate aldolase/(4S)-4-hydroxy-2-oxoglutarate aldolase